MYHTGGRLQTYQEGRILFLYHKGCILQWTDNISTLESSDTTVLPLWTDINCVPQRPYIICTFLWTGYISTTMYWCYLHTFVNRDYSSTRVAVHYLSTTLDKDGSSTTRAVNSSCTIEDKGCRSTTMDWHHSLTTPTRDYSSVTVDRDISKVHKNCGITFRSETIRAVPKQTARSLLGVNLCTARGKVYYSGQQLCTQHNGWKQWFYTKSILLQGMKKSSSKRCQEFHHKG